jgi:FtsZ-binding cell division protein ZapB
VVYVFDGVRATRIAISTVAGVSIFVPVIALVLHWQLDLSPTHGPIYVPTPSFRINTASVLTTVADLFFLAVAWELLGRRQLRLPIWLRSFLTLLGVMWLDVLLFTTGAFWGQANYTEILSGTFLSRLLMCLFAYPFLFAYLEWQNRRYGMEVEHRPVLAILKEVTDVRLELTLAQQEIERRKTAEVKLSQTVDELQEVLEQLRTSEEQIKSLRAGLLTVCAWTKRIHHDGRWMAMDEFLGKYLHLNLTHGISEEAMSKALQEARRSPESEVWSREENPPA